MAKTENPMDAVTALIDELRTERAEARRYQQETDARLRSLEADLQAARAAANGVNPMPGDTRQLLEHFDRSLHARKMEEKTREFFDNHDRATCEVYRKALAGDAIYFVMAESSPADNGSGRVISNGGTSRCVGVSSPDESPEVRRELAIAKWAKLVGANSRPSHIYVQQATPEEADEIRAAFAKHMESENGNNNSLIELSKSFVRRALQKHVAAKKAAQPAPEDREFPDRYSPTEGMAMSAIQPLFQGIA